MLKYKIRLDLIFFVSHFHSSPSIRSHYGSCIHPLLVHMTLFWENRVKTLHQNSHTHFEFATIFWEYLPPGPTLPKSRQKWVASVLHGGVRCRSVTFIVHINLVVVVVVVVVVVAEFVARYCNSCVISSCCRGQLMIKD